MSREMPAPAPRKDARHVVMSKDPKIHAVIKLFLGFGRDFPPEILDDCLLDSIDEILFESGGDIQKTAQVFIDRTPREVRAQCRAVLMNLSRMRRENKGALPWEA